MIDSDQKGNFVCYVDHNDDSLAKKPLASTNYDGSLSIAAKWMHLNNAAGEVGPIVLIFAVPNMPEGECFVRKIEGLIGILHIQIRTGISSSQSLELGIPLFGNGSSCNMLFLSSRILWKEDRIRYECQ